MIPRIFVRVLFGLQVGRPWLEQWENSENIKKKLSEFPDQKKATGKSFRAVGWQPWSNSIKFFLDSGISRNSLFL